VIIQIKYLSVAKRTFLIQYVLQSPTMKGYNLGVKVTKLRQHCKLLRQEGRKLQRDPLFSNSVSHLDQLATISGIYEDLSILSEKLAADRILESLAREEIRQIEDRIRKYTKTLLIFLNTKIDRLV